MQFAGHPDGWRSAVLAVYRRRLASFGGMEELFCFFFCFFYILIKVPDQTFITVLEKLYLGEINESALEIQIFVVFCNLYAKGIIGL